MSVKIILLAGWSQAGKDTAADFFREQYGCQKLSFAEAPKIAVAAAYRFPYAWTQTHEGKALEIRTDTGTRTVRDLIIEYANSTRAKNPYAWAEVIAKQIRDSPRVATVSKTFVISDWRFIDELVGLQRELPTTEIYPVQILRPTQIISPVGDSSEYQLVGFPFFKRIINPGNIQFFRNIDNCMDDVLLPTIKLVDPNLVE